jgi:hypothetical protein
MSEQIDSYLLSVGLALSRQQIDVNRAAQMLSAPDIIDHVDGSNIQQLIRLSLMTAQMDPGSAMLAEVGVLLSIIKPGLDIDFGLQVGVANAQSCAVFAMFSITFEQGNLPAALATIGSMIPSLKAANDLKGLLEVYCWMGIIRDEAKHYAEAAESFSAAISLIDDPATADMLLDNSALDMVRADNRNVFQFPMLRFLQLPQSTDVATALRDLLNAVESKRRQ